MISKNIGRSQTDLMRAFENIKCELMNLHESSAAEKQNITEGIDEKVSWVHPVCIYSNLFFHLIFFMP